MIELQAFITAMSPLLIAIITGIGGWFAGRKKHKAEATLLEIKAVTAIKEFYETALNDTKKQLDYYIQQTENNSKEIEANKIELHEMRLFITQLLDQSCTVQNCIKRRSIHIDNLKKMKENHEIYKDSNTQS